MPQEENIKNKINYHLRKNPLTSSDENLFMACVGKKDTQRQDAVIEHMMKRNTTISKQDICGVGLPVVLDLFKARVSIRGGFTSFDDEFEKTEHKTGSLIGIHGKNLMPDEDDPTIMLNPEGSDEMIPMGAVMDVSDRMVMVNLPADIAAGTYTVLLVFREGKKLVHVPYDENIIIT